jgi:hypothetical protein
MSMANDNEEHKGDIEFNKVYVKKTMKLKTEREMNQNKQKLERLHSLYNDSNVPLNMISKRLHIPYSRVRKIINENVNDPSKAFS